MRCDFCSRDRKLKAFPEPDVACCQSCLDGMPLRRRLAKRSGYVAWLIFVVDEVGFDGQQRLKADVQYPGLGAGYVGSRAGQSYSRATDHYIASVDVDCDEFDALLRQLAPVTDDAFCYGIEFKDSPDVH